MANLKKEVAGHVRKASKECAKAVEHLDEAMDVLGLDSIKGYYPEEPLLCGQLVELARQLRFLQVEALGYLADALEES